MLLVFMLCFGMQAANFTIEQTLSDEAQRNTIAFDGLAFLTGDLCSDSFIPPGKVADFFGFQYLRDNDPDQMGHNTDFLTRISNNVLYILTDSQVEELIAMAEEQVARINEYGYMRFPLMQVFRRLLEGDVPEGCDGLDKQAVMDYSAQLYRLDGEISYQRAEVIGIIIRALDQEQLAYLDSLAAVGMLSWPVVGDQLDPRGYDHDVHVAVMTFASQLFSWYAGSIEADTYFCPERQGTYFGSFYLKDMPAMGNPNYSIDPNLTAEKGAAFLEALTESQAQLVRGLVDIQRDDLYEIVDRRSDIATLLRRFMTEDSVDKTTVLSLAERYGQLDGEIVYNYATNFAQVGQSLSSSQMEKLMEIRDLDEYPCSGAYLYSEPIEMPDIINTDFLFTGGTGGGGGGDSPEITLSCTRMEFGIVGETVTGAQTFNITNTGTGTLNWSVSSDAAWLVASPTTGIDSGVVTVTVHNTGLAVGPHNAALTISAPNTANSPQTFTVSLKVYNPVTTTKPFGEFAAPVNGSTVRSSIPVSGWALDEIGVQSVKLYREADGALVYIGDAAFVEGARPDVEQAYPGYPNNYKAGWGYMLLTNFLPDGGNGTFTIHAVATDLEGNQVTLGTKTIICDNVNAVKPFGAIDTPAQGGTASGSEYVNFGWALTPLPNTIPTDGSTIRVWVDGVPLGNPIYNRYREDIATLFPGYNNSNGAVGYFSLDTTKYENGVHTIYWSIEDDAGNSDGIGSRYFTIRNSSVDSGQWTVDSGWSGDFLKIPLDNLSPVKIKKGFNLNIEPQTIYPDNKGMITIKIKELERLEIHFFDPGVSTSAALNVEPRILNLSPLPIGSFLDSQRGGFYWHAGPGFIGEYRFVFIEKRPNGELKKRNITVAITPKFQMKKVIK